jgi:hypothetical protein
MKDLNTLVAHGYAGTLNQRSGYQRFRSDHGPGVRPVSGARPAFTATPAP